MIHQTAVIEEDAELGKNIKVQAHAYIGSNARIGDNCSIGHCAFIGANTVIGNNCKIHNGANIYKGCCIQNNVTIGPNVVVSGTKHLSRKEFHTVLIKQGAFIGANSTILASMIGIESIVGANSLVLDTVDDRIIVMGIPAKYKKGIQKKMRVVHPIKCTFDERVKVIPADSIVYTEALGLDRWYVRVVNSTTFACDVTDEYLEEIQ